MSVIVIALELNSRRPMDKNIFPNGKEGGFLTPKTSAVLGISLHITYYHVFFLGYILDTPSQGKQ